MVNNETHSNSRGLIYFIICLLLWVIIDWGTAGGFRVSYFIKYGFTLLIFYFFYPLIFTFLVFRAKWNEKQLLLSTLFAIFIVEVILTRNPLVMTFPVCLLAIPLAVLVYLPLTFFPLWIVRQEMQKHKVVVILCIITELAIMVLTTFGSA
jgi:hypothetical protein